MARDDTPETGWRDIADAMTFAPIAWLFFLPGAFLESTAGLIGKFAEAPPKPSPLSFVIRPLKVVADAVKRAGTFFGDHSALLLGTAWAAAVPALLAGGKVALMSGIVPAATAAGGVQVLGVLGAVLGGAAVAVAAYPFAAAALASAVTLTIGAGLSIRDTPKIWKAYMEGIRESLLWRPGAKAAATEASSPAAPPPAPETTPVPVLMRDFNQTAREIEKADSAERIRFLKSLRRKYPAEFADALRLDPHEPELRKDIQVQKPLSLKRQRGGSISGVRR